ncbi:MAG: CBS domain-containing protein, partial [Henriciella sp.]
PTVPEGTNLEDAIVVLSELGLGCVGVLDTAGHLSGMLTDGDIRRIVRDRKHYKTVDEAMTRDPVTVDSTGLAHSAISIMSERNITQLFVVDDDQCCGIIHMHDVLKAGVV